MLKRLRGALSPSMAVALLALFVALGGVGIAATGGNFILGTPNTATSVTELSASGATTASALELTNGNAATGTTALELHVPAGHAPLEVDSTTKVARLNADWLDGSDATSFIKRGTALSSSVSRAGGVIDVTNTGDTNGVQGRTESSSAAGVYGEHVGPGGFGVAGRAGNFGNGVYGDNTGDGYAGWFEDKVKVGGNLELSGNLSCTGCIAAGAIGGKVDDSEKLDGIDSTGFIQGPGSADAQAISQAPGENAFLGPAFGGLVRLRYLCPLPGGGNGTLTIQNASAGSVNFFVDSGGANPDYFLLGSNDSFTYPASRNGESFHIQAQGAPGVLTLDVATVHRSGFNDCHSQALGVMAR